MKDRKYVNDYSVNPSASAFSENRVLYTGKKYLFEAGEEKARRTIAVSAVLSGCSFALMLLSGFVNSGASHTFYIIIPYVVALILTAVFFFNSVSVVRFCGYVTRKQYDMRVARQKALSLSALVLSAVTLAGAAVMAFLKVFVFPGDLVFSVFIAASGVCQFFCVRLSSLLKCGPEQ